MFNNELILSSIDWIILFMLSILYSLLYFIILKSKLWDFKLTLSLSSELLIIEIKSSTTSTLGLFKSNLLIIFLEIKNGIFEIINLVVSGILMSH